VYRKGSLFGERGETRSAAAAAAAAAAAERDRDDCARRRGPRVRRWVGRRGAGGEGEEAGGAGHSEGVRRVLAG